MTFEELITDPLLQTPKPTTYDGDFFEYVTTTLSRFQKKVNSLVDETIEIPGVKYKPRLVKQLTKIVVKGITDCIDAYLDGRINEAYDNLDDTFNHERKSFYDIIRQSYIYSGEDFYRIRRNKVNFLFTPSELFHIPYESRGCVRNQRFSINGFPSLYLSGNLYTCWEEMHRPDLNEFQAIRFVNNDELVVLDLTPPNQSELLTRENYRYILTWPIIFACSIKVKNRADIFKPEYIIPQMLLQWVRQNDDIDCIRYFSTNIDSYNTQSKGDFSNYVFPVKENAKTGYCAQLKAMFSHTEPISWQTYQMATGGQSFSYLRDEFNDINNKIPHLEIIKNRPYPYSYSILGKLEHYLNKLDAREINF